MQYVVKRTSVFGDEKPCKEAYRKDDCWLDYRAAKSLAIAHKRSWADTFFNGGSNHREQNGMVVRDIPETIWVIDIDDFTAFVDKYGAIVLMPSRYKHTPYQVEIYDSYRE